MHLLHNINQNPNDIQFYFYLSFFGLLDKLIILLLTTQFQQEQIVEIQCLSNVPFCIYHSFYFVNIYI